jgi:hypothetical protein
LFKNFIISNVEKNKNKNKNTLIKKLTKIDFSIDEIIT